MSRLLEAAQNKPPELVQAEETLKALAAERERALEVLGELNSELTEAQAVLDAAEVKAGDAEAKARIDGNKADGKALEVVDQGRLRPGRIGAEMIGHDDEYQALPQV